MSRFTATFRIVTPMFLGGAEPMKEAELPPCQPQLHR